MSRNFYGLGEVCLMGVIDNDESPSARSSGGGGEACGSYGEDVSAATSIVGSRGSTSGSITQLSEHTNTADLEVDYLRSQLDLATRLLADKEEAIDTLSSELTAYKSLYKEAIQTTHSAGQLEVLTPGPVTPEPTRMFGRANSSMQLRSRYAADNDDDGETNDDQQSSSEGGTPLPPRPPTGQPHPCVRPKGARLGRSYSWRDSRKRSISGTLSPSPSLPPKSAPKPAMPQQQEGVALLSAFLREIVRLQ